MAKLTKEQLVEEMGLGSSQKHIAAKYGITQSAVSQKIKQLGGSGITRHTASKESHAESPKGPSTTVIGRAGGSRSFAMAGNETYNPDTITIPTYRKMTFDAQLRAGLTVLKIPVQTAKWYIQTDDQEITDFIEANLKEWWDLFLVTLLTGINYGFSAFEKRWVEEGGAYKYKHPLELYPDSITILQNEKTGDFEGLKQRQSYSEDDMVTIPENKSFIFTNEKGESFGNLYGISRLKAAYQFWYSARYNYDFANNFFETFSSPFVIGYAPKGSQDIRNDAGAKTGEINNIDSMMEIIKNLRMRTAAALPWSPDQRWKVELLEAQRTGANFVEYIRYLDLMKIRAIFVPDLVFGHGGERGSYALGKVHYRIFLKAVGGILSSIKFHVEKYLLPQLVEYNFANYDGPVEWMYEPPSKEDRELLETIFKDLVKDGRISPDNEELAERLGIPLAEEEEVDDPNLLPDENLNPDDAMNPDENLNPDDQLPDSNNPPEDSNPDAKRKAKKANMKFKAKLNTIIDKQINNVMHKVRRITDSSNIIQASEKWSQERLPVGWISALENTFRVELVNLGYNNVKAKYMAKRIASNHNTDMIYNVCGVLEENANNNPEIIEHEVKRSLKGIKDRIGGLL